MASEPRSGHTSTSRYGPRRRSSGSSTTSCAAATATCAANSAADPLARAGSDRRRTGFRCRRSTEPGSSPWPSASVGPRQAEGRCPSRVIGGCAERAGLLHSLLHRGLGSPGPQWYGLARRMRETPPQRYWKVRNGTPGEAENRSHNPKVAGSNPAPATNENPGKRPFSRDSEGAVPTFLAILLPGFLPDRLGQPTTARDATPRGDLRVRSP